MTQLSFNSTTLDKFLDGQVLIKQPKEGYRTGMDAVLLGASIPAHEGDKVLEVGTGVGTAMLCLATRVKNCHLIGLELQEKLFELAQHNISLNQIDDRVKVCSGDLKNFSSNLLQVNSFSHVFANPPYFRHSDVTESIDDSKNKANIESETSLQQWIDFCIKMLQPNGTLTFIFATTRIDELLAKLSGKIGQITLFPLWSKQGQPAKRFIVQGIKGHFGVSKLSFGLIIHNNDGTFTVEAESILRHGCALKIN